VADFAFVGSAFLMCAPDWFDVHYLFNPHMAFSERVDRRRAKAQWRRLVRALEEACRGQGDERAVEPRVVDQLLLDRRFLRRFRRNPERALEPFGLTQEEVEAVKRGHAPELLRLGLDPAYVWPKDGSGFLQTWIVRHAKRLTPALVLAAFVLPAAPALGSPRSRVRRSAVARVSRYFARRGLGGEFAARMARAGFAGRLTSQAARGADTRAFYAFAGRAARDFGIQPPPVGGDST